VIATVIPGAFSQKAFRSIEIDLDLGLCPTEVGNLPRKEVIHPQLPLRVPCYDFVPIIDPTFRRPTATFGCYQLS
jgi:hypothetical protein